MLAVGKSEFSKFGRVGIVLGRCRAELGYPGSAFPWKQEEEKEEEELSLVLEKFFPCSHVLGIARRAKPAEGSMQNMHSSNSRPTLPMDTGNGRNFLDQSPGRATGNLQKKPKKTQISSCGPTGAGSWKCSGVCGVGDGEG